MMISNSVLYCCFETKLRLIFRWVCFLTNATLCSQPQKQKQKAISSSSFFPHPTFLLSRIHTHTCTHAHMYLVWQWTTSLGAPSAACNHIGCKAYCVYYVCQLCVCILCVRISVNIIQTRIHTRIVQPFWSGKKGVQSNTVKQTRVPISPPGNGLMLEKA